MAIVYVIIVAAIIAGATYYLMKSGKIEDKDGNNIPDVVDEKIAQAKEFAAEAKEVVEDVKFRAKRVAEEAKDVAEAMKEVAKQSKDVINAAKGGNRKGRKQK